VGHRDRPGSRWIGCASASPWAVEVCDLLGWWS
jgi:hypothetical protein